MVLKASQWVSLPQNQTLYIFWPSQFILKLECTLVIYYKRINPCNQHFAKVFLIWFGKSTNWDIDFRIQKDKFYFVNFTLLMSLFLYFFVILRKKECWFSNCLDLFSRQLSNEYSIIKLEYPFMISIKESNE